MSRFKMKSAGKPSTDLHPDPVESAHSAGLRYVNLKEPGIQRQCRGKQFTYSDAAGRRLTDSATLDRIKALVLPPAWEEVWICRSSNGHIQAIGRDVQGRKQYRYHERWHEVRDGS